MEGDPGRVVEDLLVKVTLYQYGRYNPYDLERELDHFFREYAIPMVCEALRRNVGCCAPELVKDYGFTEGLAEARACLENLAYDCRSGLRTMCYLADLVDLSIQLARLDEMSLSEKILLFDRVAHSTHAGQLLVEEGLASPEEASIFGINIEEIKRRADERLERMLLRRSSFRSSFS